MQSRVEGRARLGAFAALSLLVAASTVLAEDDGDAMCDRWPPCETDSDCDAGSRCWVDRRSACPDGYPSCVPGEPDEACAARAQAFVEARCEVVERASCNPSWSLPCQSDDDCGAEFACDVAQCFPVIRSCSQDGDCPGDWRCGTYDAGFCEHSDACVSTQRKLIGCVPPPYCAGVFLTGGVDVDGVDRAASNEAASSDTAGAAKSAPESSGGCSLAAAEAPARGLVTAAGWLGLALACTRRRRSGNRKRLRRERLH